jgi:hypothetical protein
MAHTMDTTCSRCNDEIRKDTYIVHIFKNHPTYFWEDIFTFVKDEETNVIELHDRSRLQLKEAYNLLNNESSYELEDELFVDFGSKQAFKTSATAMKHIQKHSKKHQENYIQLLKEGLNVDTVKKLLAFILQRKVKIIDDQNEVIRQVQKQTAEYKKEFLSELNEMRTYNDKCKQFMERDEVKELERIQEELHQLKKELKDANNVMRHQDAELYGYRTSYAKLESVNEASMIKEMSEMSYYEKAKLNCEAKMKKHEEECNKKIKKAKEEMDEVTEKFEKKEKKLKAEVKAYKQEIQLVKLRAKQSDSDSD